MQNNLRIENGERAQGRAWAITGDFAAKARRALWTTVCAVGVVAMFPTVEPVHAQSERPSTGRPTAPRVSQPSTAPVRAPSSVSQTRGSHRGKGGGSSYSKGRRHGGEGVRGGHRYRGGRSARYYGGYRYGSHYRNSYYFGLTYPWSWYWGYYGPYAYGSYGYHPYGYGYGYGSDYYSRANAGALDLDIKPEEARIFIDGNEVGIADNYDGFPRYLWLEAGTHNVVIFHEGYETLAKQIKLGAGVVVRLKDKMVPGTAKSPDEMYAQLAPLPRRNADDEREAPLAPWRFREQAEDDDERYDDREERDYRDDRDERSRTRSSDREGDRDAQRSPRSREQWRQRGGSSRATTQVETDLRSEASKVVFEIEPSDAVLYLDGRFIGTSRALNEQGGRVLVDPGNHTVEVTRPGYESRRIEFTVEAGGTETVEVELKKSN